MIKKQLKKVGDYRNFFEPLMVEFQQSSYISEFNDIAKKNIPVYFEEFIFHADHGIDSPASDVKNWSSEDYTNFVYCTVHYQDYTKLDLKADDNTELPSEEEVDYENEEELHTNKNIIRNAVYIYDVFAAFAKFLAIEKDLFNGLDEIINTIEESKNAIRFDKEYLHYFLTYNSIVLKAKEDKAFIYDADVIKEYLKKEVNLAALYQKYDDLSDKYNNDLEKVFKHFTQKEHEMLMKDMTKSIDFSALENPEVMIRLNDKIEKFEKSGSDDMEGFVKSLPPEEQSAMLAMLSMDMNKNPTPSRPPSMNNYSPSGEKMGRNDPCFCGSGKKFKKCCGKNA